MKLNEIKKQIITFIVISTMQYEH